MAPDSRVVNIKVGAFDGATDVSQVIAALDWVVQYKATNGLNIKIINLSFGTQSANPYTTDPLAFATEVARKKGLLVVAAGGNDGTTAAGLDDPAYDPYVLAVGADDPMGTFATTDDTVPRWASHGTSARPVDIVAPATHVISLRDPGSSVDAAYGTDGLVGNDYFRGSGTSQATAVVSGMAAVLFQKYPKATPDQMKKLLMNTATPLVTGASANYWGKGIVNGGKAVTTALPTFTQTGTASTGKGTLEGARGAVHVISNGTTGAVDLSGEKEIFGAAFSSSTWASKSSSAAA